MSELDAISSIGFPATKQELVEAAVEANLSQETIERIQALEHEQYEDADAVERELDDLLGGAPGTTA